MAVALGVDVLYGLGAFVYREQLFEALEHHDAEFEVIMASFSKLAIAGLFIHTIVLATVAAVTVGWARALRGRERGLAIAGVVALVLSILSSAPVLVQQLPGIELELFEDLRWLFAVSAALQLAGLSMLLLAARPPSGLAYVHAALAAVWVLFFFYVDTLPVSEAGEVPRMVWPAMDVVLSGLWIVGAFMVRTASDPASAADGVADQLRSTAARGLRAFLSGFIVKLVAAIGGTVLVGFAANSADPSSAATVTWALVLVNLLATVFMVSGLLSYTRLPAQGVLTGCVIFTMLALGFAVLLDIWAAAATSQLMSMVADARAATSMWSMPSYSEMEALQQRMQWGGRLASAIGLVGAITLVLSLRATAVWLMSEDAQRRVDILLPLSIVGVVVSLAAGFVLQSGEVKDPVVLLLGGLGTLAFATWLLATWIGVLTTMIRELEAPVTEDSLGPASSRVSPPAAEG